MTKPTSDMVARMLGADRAVEVPAGAGVAPYVPCDKKCGPFSMHCVRPSDHAGKCTGFIVEAPELMSPPSPMAKAAAAFRQKAEQEEADYQARRSDQGLMQTEWGPTEENPIHDREAPQLNRDQSVAVSPTYTYNEDMTQAPRGVKLILLGQGGVAQLSEYNGDAFWIGWAALPRRATP